MQNFRRLHVWERAHSFAVAVRRCTHRFPKTGYADVKSQLARAAESIASNIVEGCGAATPKEFARYLDISIKSTSETEYWLQLAKDFLILDVRTWARLTREAVEIRKMLFGLRRTVLTADQSATESRRDTTRPASSKAETTRKDDGRSPPTDN